MEYFLLSVFILLTEYVMNFNWASFMGIYQALGPAQY